VVDGARGVAVPIWGTGRAADRRAATEAVAAALAASGADERTLLGHGTDGRPLWPTGWSGSISHGAGIAIAVAAPATAGRVGIGVDVESVCGLSVEDARVVLSADEIARVAAGSPHDPTIVWSAKEAAFKAWSHAAGPLPPVDPVDIAVSVTHRRLGEWDVVVEARGSLRSALADQVTAVLAVGRVVVGASVVTLVGLGT
jgi:4'-phosphopantetheinyl transferase EntD